MKVLNIHRRLIGQPKSRVVELFATMATKDDKIWPTEEWPPMRFKGELQVGAEGGHGPIRYKVSKYDPAESVEFEFQRPKGFNGIHKLEIIKQNEWKTEIRHTIQMNTRGSGTIAWVLAIKWLHNALLEDAFDKVENQLTNVKKTTEWSNWVRVLRKIMGAKRKGS